MTQTFPKVRLLEHPIGPASAFAVFLSTLVSTSALACTCPVQDEAAIVSQADVVFEGQISGATLLPPAGMNQSTRLRVNRTIKGKPGKSITIQTTLVGSACGYDFRSTKRRLKVAANFDRNRKIYTTNACLMDGLNHH